MVLGRTIKHQEDNRFLTFVQKTDEYLLSRRETGPQETSVELLDRLPNGNLFIQKRLGNGLQILALMEKDRPILTLQIFLDPLRFSKWKKSLGPVALFYMNPYGIEVCFKHKWSIVVDAVEVSIPEGDEVQEVVRIEIQDAGGERKLTRIPQDKL